MQSNLKAPFAVRIFANAGRAHMKKYGTTMLHFEKIAEKNRKHGALNPLAQYKLAHTRHQINSSRMVHYPLSKL